MSGLAALMPLKRQNDLKFHSSHGNNLGRVSGIVSQSKCGRRAGCQRQKRDFVAKGPLRYPAKTMLIEAPSPVAVPTNPCARLKWPDP